LHTFVYVECRPILEYADTLWDPTNKSACGEIEHVQNQAIRFIVKLKGRCGISDARTELQLKILASRQRDHRITLLMRILSDEERHETLSSAYDELLNSNRSINTRSTKRGELASVSASSQTFHNCFLPRSIRDLRIPPRNIFGKTNDTSHLYQYEYATGETTLKTVPTLSADCCL